MLSMSTISDRVATTSLGGTITNLAAVLGSTNFFKTAQIRAKYGAAFRTSI